jgi:hypothetical protein
LHLSVPALCHLHRQRRAWKRLVLLQRLRQARLLEPLLQVPWV